MEQWFGVQILKWYDTHGRKALPWKNPKSPYSIWLSEIMLQQTQVATVIPYFEKFIHAFPTLDTLAKASMDEVIALWAGLGYYARARNLHKTAGILKAEWDGAFPKNELELQSLPGIGRSTAAAILAQSHDIRAPILDGNVKRVLCRFYGVIGWPGSKSVQDRLWALSEQVTPFIRANDYTQGIMDVGALVCKRSQPLCLECPLSEHCIAFNQNTIKQYPESKPAKVKVVKKTNFVMLLNEEFKILLQKRPPKGIWGGLWCLPEQSHLIELNLSFKLISKKALRRHTFTHYHLEYETLLGRGLQQDYPKNYFWYRLSDLKPLGLPAPHKILMSELIAQLKRELDDEPYRLLCEAE